MKWELPDKKLRSKDSSSSLKRYINSFFNAVSGIKYCVIYEHNMVIIILAIIVTTCCGFLFDIAAYEWLFIIACFGRVSGCELLNSAIEAAVDLDTIELNPLAKVAKDCGSGATLIFSVISLVGALVIFIPKIIEYMG